MTKYEHAYMKELADKISTQTQERLSYPITVKDRYRLSLSQAFKHLLYVAAVDMVKDGRYGEEFLSLSTLEQQEILEAYPEDGMYQVYLYYKDSPHPLRTLYQTRGNALAYMNQCEGSNKDRRIAYRIREGEACPNSETR